MSQIADEHAAIEHGTSRTGRWLRARRVRIVLWIAAIEAVLAAVGFGNISRWLIIFLAVLAVSLYFAAGRDSRSDTFRQSSWIFAASQLLAVIATILSFLLVWAAIIAVVVFAVIALYFVFTDRR